MNISIITLSKGVEKGLNFEQIITLLIKEDGITYLFDKYEFQEQGLFLLGYLDAKGEITLKGKEFLKSIADKNELVSNKKDNWYEELHKKLENELVTLTKRKQKVIGGKYSFLCNSKDLEYKLSKTIKKYKLEDKVKVEKLLLKHIFNCYKANWEFAKLIEYYIEKSGISQLATDYSNFQEKEAEVKQDIEPKEIKNLF